MIRTARQYVIRRAEARDAAAVARELDAYLAHIGAALDASDLDRDIAQWPEVYDGVCGALLVLEGPGGSIVGTAAVRVLEPGIGELKRMWIRPLHQGMGLGRVLMDRCLEEARRLGCRRLRLDTQRGMQAALRLYRAYGFREIADYNGNPRAQIWMEAIIGQEEQDMANATVAELKAKSDAAWKHLGRQLDGMDSYLERSDAPGEWTVREVICHLLLAPGWKPSALLGTFADRDLPVVDIKPGETFVTPERRGMTLPQLRAELDEQRRDLCGYLDGLGDADLGRKARIPLFKQFMGTDEIPIPMFVGAMFDYHWNDHAGQLAKIRRAVGLPEAP
jgi:ribosomal protein S18 acetylase RimI-like enzyme